MEKTITELNEYCMLHNYSIRLDRNARLNGFNTYDYARW